MLIEWYISILFYRNFFPLYTCRSIASSIVVISNFDCFLGTSITSCDVLSSCDFLSLCDPLHFPRPHCHRPLQHLMSPSLVSIQCMCLPSSSLPLNQALPLVFLSFGPVSESLGFVHPILFSNLLRSGVRPLLDRILIFLECSGCLIMFPLQTKKAVLKINPVRLGIGVRPGRVGSVGSHYET